jgi:D-glycero-alpha-D-manno-heptose-7-phosphate kinase
MMDKATLARDAIHIEQEVIGESVGSQDQISAAFGGFNRIEFHRNNSFDIAPVILPGQRQQALSQHLMLCFTGVSRIASDIAKSKIENLASRARELEQMHEMVDEAVDILQDHRRPISDFGELLHAGWEHKRRLSEQVSTPQIDTLYAEARRAGAIGGKILGAGGGGFMLLFAKPEAQAEIRARLRHLVHVPFQFEDTGSRVVLYQPNGL